MNGVGKYIPNALTCCNLIFGCVACVAGLEGHYFHAMLSIFIAVGFDFADGLAARLLKAYSSIGKDLDSLADMVSFGVAPGLMLFRFIDERMATVSLTHPLISCLFYIGALAIPVCSALRLAKFNNDTRQTTTFIGLPVPAHAIFWSSLICALLSGSGSMLSGMSMEIEPFILLTVITVVAIVTSLLLVSEVPMFSLKVKSLAWKGNELRYLLILGAVALTVWLGITGIAATILLYILLSFVGMRRVK
ncbi:phosphatidylcholine/phosphatidylserine synthase [Tannerella sp.]|uniref:CDP-alcohol phosphatidyltransferase family protein n=1 Tax=Tannerella sp. TaxID=2382127 RepID=UPI0026DC2CED|nr:CDP-alcohol phosphatidyltransferase family protein [Tannerella sp.]MDO4703885.1 CDP-alcohol phosphatidyltransferase family protein [Tannerella sp.]